MSEQSVGLAPRGFDYYDPVVFQTPDGTYVSARTLSDYEDVKNGKAKVRRDGQVVPTKKAAKDTQPSVNQSIASRSSRKDGEKSRGQRMAEYVAKLSVVATVPGLLVYLAANGPDPREVPPSEALETALVFPGPSSWVAIREMGGRISDISGLFEDNSSEQFQVEVSNE